MFKHFLKAVEDRIDATGKMAYISIDWGQSEDGEQGAVKYPAALIDLRWVASRGMLNWGKRMEAECEVRVIGMNTSNISRQAPQMQREVYEAYLDKVEAVANSLHGHQNEDLQPLEVEEVERVMREDKLWEYRLRVRGCWGSRKEEGRFLELKVETKK